MIYPIVFILIRRSIRFAAPSRVTNKKMNRKEADAFFGKLEEGLKENFTIPRGSFLPALTKALKRTSAKHLTANNLLSPPKRRVKMSRPRRRTRMKMPTRWPSRKTRPRQNLRQPVAMTENLLVTFKLLYLEKIFKSKH